MFCDIPHSTRVGSIPSSSGHPLAEPHGESALGAEAGPRSAYGSPHLPDHPVDPGRLVHGVSDQMLRELRFQLNTIFTLAPFLFSGVIAFIGLGSYASVVVRLLFFSLHLVVAGIVVGAMFPISLRLFRGNKVSSMFFIDLVGCALAPVGFWIAMSMQGIPLVAAAGTGSYLAAAGILFVRGR